jgi:hypothetical protein
MEEACCSWIECVCGSGLGDLGGSGDAVELSMPHGNTRPGRVGRILWFAGVSPKPSLILEAVLELLHRLPAVMSVAALFSVSRQFAW